MHSSYTSLTTKHEINSFGAEYLIISMCTLTCVDICTERVKVTYHTPSTCTVLLETRASTVTAASTVAQVHHSSNTELNMITVSDDQ